MLPPVCKPRSNSLISLPTSLKDVDGDLSDFNGVGLPQPKTFRRKSCVQLDGANERRLAPTPFAHQRATQIGKAETKPKTADEELLERLDQQERPLYIEKSENAQCILNPYGGVRRYFDLMMLFFILYVAIVTPSKVAFDIPRDTFAWFIVDRILDVVFILDIILNFCTAHEENAVLILDRRRNVIHYLKGWFWLDLVASIPLEFVFSMLEGSDVVSQGELHVMQLPRVLRVLKFMKFLRLIRLLKLLRIFSRLEDSFILRFSVLTIIKFFFFCLLWCHWVSCAFYLAARDSWSEQNIYLPNSWVANTPRLAEASLSEKYVASFYFALSTVTTIGYGDIHARSEPERILTLFLMIMGTCMFAYGITNIVTIYSGLNERKNQFRQKMDKINMYIAEKKLPQSLQQKIREYFLFMKRHNLGVDDFRQERQFLSELSIPLRTEVTNYINHGLLSLIPFLAGCNPRFKAAFIERLKFRFYCPGEVIIKEGAQGGSMYILNKGCAEVAVRGYRVAQLQSGSVFGEIALLGITNERTATVRALTCCDMRVIERHAFLALATLFPAEREKFEQEAKWKLMDLSQRRVSEGSPVHSMSCLNDFDSGVGPEVATPVADARVVRSSFAPLVDEGKEEDLSEWLNGAWAALPRLTDAQLTSFQLRVSAEMLLRLSRSAQG